MSLKINSNFIYDPNVLRRDIGHFRSAINLARESLYQTRVGCLAAINNRVVAGAFNTIRNNPRNVEYLEATRHAEYNCIKLLANWMQPRVTLYIARINRSSETLPSRPCKHCMELIHVSEVREIVYLSKNNKIVKEVLRDYDYRAIHR